MGQGTLYRYVDGKRELLDLVFDMCVAELMAVMEPDELFEDADIRDEALPEVIALDLGARLYALIDNHPGLVKMLTVQAGAVDEELRYRVQGLYGTLDGILRRGLEYGRADGWIEITGGAPEESTVLRRLLPGLVVPGLVLTLTERDTAEKRESFVRSAGVLLRHGVLAEGARRRWAVGAEPERRGSPTGGHARTAGTGAPSGGPGGRAGELLDAAMAECLDRGYAALGVRDITERAGVSHGTFYNYFKNKRQMLSVLIGREFSMLFEILTRARDRMPQSVSPDVLWDSVRTTSTELLRHIGERRAEFTFLILEGPGVDSEALQEYLDLYHDGARRLGEILQPAREVGIINEEIDQDYLHEVWVSCLIAAMSAVIADIEDAPPEISGRVIADLYLNGAVRRRVAEVS